MSVGASTPDVWIGSEGWIGNENDESIKAEKRKKNDEKDQDKKKKQLRWKKCDERGGLKKQKNVLKDEDDEEQPEEVEDKKQRNERGERRTRKREKHWGKRTDKNH